MCCCEKAVEWIETAVWCPNEPVTVSVARLTANILCRQHNSLLSPVDDGGIDAYRAFQGAEHSAGTKPFASAVDGLLLERWLLKTAINLSYRHGLKLGVGMWNSVPGIPSAYLLDVVFGNRSFSHSMGAYFLFPQEQFLYQKGQGIITPIHKNGEIGGVYFHISGFDIFLPLFPGAVPPKLGEMGITALPPHILSAVMAYRSPTIITLDIEKRPHETRFDWG